MKTSTREEKQAFLNYGREEVDDLCEVFRDRLVEKSEVMDAYKIYKVFAKERRHVSLNAILLDIVATGEF